MVLLVFSCTPKPPPVPTVPTVPTVPKWIDGQAEDSLYLYSVASLDLGNSAKEKLDDIAFSQISGLIKKEVSNRLKHVSDSSGANFIGYFNHIIETRGMKSLKYMEIVERYQDKNNKYVLARLDKEKY